MCLHLDPKNPLETCGQSRENYKFPFNLMAVCLKKTLTFLGEKKSYIHQRLLRKFHLGNSFNYYFNYLLIKICYGGPGSRNRSKYFSRTSGIMEEKDQKTTNSH